MIDDALLSENRERQLIRCQYCRKAITPRRCQSRVNKITGNIHYGRYTVSDITILCVRMYRILLYDTHLPYFAGDSECG